MRIWPLEYYFTCGQPMNKPLFHPFQKSQQFCQQFTDTEKWKALLAGTGNPEWEPGIGCTQTEASPTALPAAVNPLL